MRGPPRQKKAPAIVDATRGTELTRLTNGEILAETWVGCNHVYRYVRAGASRPLWWDLSLWPFTLLARWRVGG